MTAKLEQAMAELVQLPTVVQDLVADEMLSQIAKVRSLREDLDEGLTSLAAGRGRAIDVEDVIRDAQESARS